jgi:ABC-type oligopeptide transport system substrate-binding subunit
MTRLNPRLVLVVAAAFWLAACGPAAPPAATTAPGAPPNASGTQATSAPAALPTSVVASKPTAAPVAAPPQAAAPTQQPLPADAAPLDQQVLVLPYDNSQDFTTFDFMESVYKRGTPGVGSDLMTEPLVRLNKNFEIVPAGAQSWSSDTSGTVWTFKLDPNLIWSDDTPVTADDYVATFQYAADPQHAWDFAWFYGGVIKNWNDVVAGKVPVDQLGVTAIDPHTFQVTTEQPAPYLPAMMLYSMSFQKKALQEHGGLYNSDPATSVSDGPFILQEWRKGDRVILVANPKYKGTNKSYIQKVVVIGMANNAMLAAYQAGEIDYVAGANLTPADNDLIAADPGLSKEVHPHYGDFRTDYLFFDNQNPPFNNLKVRQAFSHVIPRDDIIKQILKPTQAIPAYSFLMPGFPASNSEGLKDIQNYDPATAKQLLADAGYPDGQGFPHLTLWLRDETPAHQAAYQAIAASIKQNLNIEVDVSNKETKTFTDAMNAKPPQIQFGAVSYGFDFLDPYNMLSVFLGTGRHNWMNGQYDDEVKKAAAFTGDPAQRTAMFQDAEKLLVSDVGAVFVDHRTVADIYKPYLKGTELEPDKNGLAAMHWPTFVNMSTLVGSLYISKDAAGRKLPN